MLGSDMRVRVLIVDDTKSSRQYHAKLVEEMGCEVFQANSGSVGLILFALGVH